LAGRKAGRPVDVPCQWSAGVGVGIQYDINPHFGIYIEPELYRYFDNAGQVQTIRTERPLNITIPVGIRFSW
jgi:RNA polymerase sigma-70 factor (ECF subfamily)